MKQQDILELKQLIKRMKETSSAIDKAAKGEKKDMQSRNLASLANQFKKKIASLR